MPPLEVVPRNVPLLPTSQNACTKSTKRFAQLLCSDKSVSLFRRTSRTGPKRPTEISAAIRTSVRRNSSFTASKTSLQGVSLQRQLCSCTKRLEAPQGSVKNKSSERINRKGKRGSTESLELILETKAQMNPILLELSTESYKAQLNHHATKQNNKSFREKAKTKSKIALAKMGVSQLCLSSLINLHRV